MENKIPRIRIPVYESQIQSVTSAINEGHLAQGPHLQLFAQKLREIFGMNYVVLTANTFSSLFAVLKAYGDSKTTVITSSVSTCFAMVNAIRAAGMELVYEDVDLTSASVPKIKAPVWGRQNTVAVVPDHFGSVAPSCKQPRNDQSLLIEDAAQAFLSRTHIRTEADVLVLSFYPTKIINGIDGGAILTNREDIYESSARLVSYKNQIDPPPAPRFNLGMKNINAAFALGTLMHLEEIQNALLRINCSLRKAVEKAGYKTLHQANGEVPSRFIVLAPNSEERDQLLRKFNRAGIEASKELIWLCSHSIREEFQVAGQLIERHFSLPFHPLLKAEDIREISEVLES